MLKCHICGRDFGTNSLKIHWKSCAKKRAAAQRKLPRVRAPPSHGICHAAAVRGNRGYLWHRR